MAKRNQVTTNLKITADAELKGSRNFIKKIEKIAEGLDVGTKLYGQLNKATDQLKEYNKVLEKVQNKSFITEEENKNLAKAGKEIANIIEKTENLYNSFSASDLKKFSKEYINQVKKTEKEIAKIKENYTKTTGRDSLDRDIKNLDKYTKKIEVLTKKQKELKDGQGIEIKNRIDAENKALQEQFNIYKKIEAVEKQRNNKKQEIISKYNNSNNIRLPSSGKIKTDTDNVRKDISNSKYQQIVNTYEKIVRARKEILESGKTDKQIEKDLISLAKQYFSEKVKTTAQFEKQFKILQENKKFYNSLNNRNQLTSEKEITAEIERRNKLLKEINNENNKILNANGFVSDANLTNKKKVASRVLNSSSVEISDNGAKLTSDAESQIADDVVAATNRQTKEITNELNILSDLVKTISGYNAKLATQSERVADEQDIKIGANQSIQATNEDGNATRKMVTEKNKELEKQIVAKESLTMGNVLKDTLKETPSFEDLMFSGILPQGQLDLKDTEKSKKFDSLQNDYLSRVDNLHRKAEMLRSELSTEEYEIVGQEGLENLTEAKSILNKIISMMKHSKAEEMALLKQEQDMMVKHNSKGETIFKDGIPSLKKGGTLEEYNNVQQKIQKLVQEYNQIDQAQTKLNVDFTQGENQLRNYNKFLKTYNADLKTTKKDTLNFSNTINEDAQALQNAAEQSQFLSSTFDDLKNKIGYFLSLNYIFDQVTRKITEAVQTTKEMDKDITQIGLVLGKTSNQVWKNFDTYSKTAERLNTTTSQVANSMKLFYQQGLNTTEVNKMVEASAIAAALGESTMAEASETLTSIINSYNLSANEAMTVTDKISQIAIVSAADFGELSTAIEKVASSAASAGLDLDHMMGYLGKMIETTREAPTNIGTALKTIVANFTQFKEDPSGLAEEGSEINKVDKALKSVGINLTDTTGEVRDLSEVLDDLGKIWDTLNRNQRSYLATQIAGTRQQSRFYALMNDYDRTLELVAEGSNSAGKAQQQFALYSNSLEAAANRLTNQWEIFFNQITQGNGLLSVFTNTLTGLMKIVNRIGPIGAVLGLGTLIKSLRGTISKFNDLQNLVKKRQKNKEKTNSLIENIEEDSSKSGQQKKDEKEKVKNLLLKEQTKQLNKLTKAEQKYIVAVERINEEQSELNIKFKDTTNLSNKMSLSLGTAGNSIKKFGATAKLAFSEVKKAAISLSKNFAILAAATIALKSVRAAFEGIKSSLGINTEAFIENAEKAQENKENIGALCDEYTTLSQKVVKTADEQARLKEITEEVTKVDAKLGQQLKDNVGNYTANIKAMKDYVAEQEKIAALNTIKTIKSKSNWTAGIGLLLNSNFWTSLFGSDNDKELLVKEQQTNWRELGNAVGKEKQLNSSQMSMLNKFVEEKITSMEDNKYHYLGYQAGTDKFYDLTVAYADSLKNLTTSQQKAYDTYLSYMSDNGHTYAELQEELSNLNLPQELKNALRKDLSTFLTSINNKIKDDKYITDKKTASKNAIEYLSYTELEKLFNPDTSSMTSEEIEYYNRDRSNLLQNTDLVKKFSDAIKNGDSALKDFTKELSATGNYSEGFIASIYDIEKAISSANFENAITNFVKLGDLDIDSLLKGTASQLSILEMLGKGLLDFKDIIVATDGTMAINNAAMIKEQQKNLDIIFNTLENQIEKRRRTINSITDESSNKNLKNTQNVLDKINLARTEKKAISYYGNAEDYGGISGNIDLNDRIRTDLGNNSYGTENSITISAELENGLGEMQYIIPTIINGIQQSEEDAIEYFKKTGEYIAAFTTDTAKETVEAYANAIHERNQEWYQDELSKANNILNNVYGDKYKGGYDNSKQTYSSAVIGAGGFRENIKVSEISDKSLRNNINNLDKKRENIKNGYQANNNEIAVRSEYAKRTVDTGVQDTSIMTQAQKLEYIQKQNKALEEAKSKVNDLDKNSQEYYNTTYKIYKIQDDLKEVFSNDEDLVKNLNKTSAQLTDEANATKESYKKQKKAAKEVQNEINKQLNTESAFLDKIKEKMSENLTYQKSYAGFFDGLAMDNTLTSQLDAVKTAYQQLGDTITDTDQLQSTLASNPKLIQALDATSEGLTWNKQKLEEMGIQSIDTSYNYIESRINEMEATKAVLETESDDIENWSASTIERVANVITGNNSLTNTQQSNAQAQATNLGISEQDWINWSDGVCKAIAAAGEEYNKFIDSQKNNEKASYKNGYNASRQVSGNSGVLSSAADIANKVSQDKINKNKKDILNTLKSTGYSGNKKGAIDNINKQIELLRGLQNGLKYKKSNIGDYLGGNLYGKDSGGSGDSFNSLVEKLDKFYNYMRQLEDIEAKLNRLREKRNLIDANKSYYIDDLEKENKLLREQQAIYNNYIRDEGTYLEELRKQLSSAYSDWVYFTDSGTVQVKQTEFNINSEDEQERYENFSELLNLYQEEYNTREENINKLYEIENTQLENIKTAYEKILSRVTDVTDELERQMDLLDHSMTMNFGNIGKFDIMDEQMFAAVKGIENARGYLNNFQNQIENLNKEIKSSAFNELLTWDEILQHWTVAEEKLQDTSIVAKYEKMGYTWRDVDIYVRSVAAKSEAIRNSWKETEDSLNSFSETLKGLIDNRISAIQDYFSAASNELNKVFDSFDNKIEEVDNRNSYFGTTSEALEEKYLALVSATAILKQTLQQLTTNKDNILSIIEKKYPEYITMVNGVAVVNKQAAQESSKLTEEQKAELLQLIGVYEASADQIEELESKLNDYFSSMVEMEREKRDAIIEMKTKIHDELMTRDQQEIDDLRTKYDKMSELDNEYYSELSQRISDARNLRSQRQESNNIGTMQAQLATLKTDNSGTYNAQIIELQKQLNEALQNQADNEVDRELERIQREQQQREEDRQLQISAMENVLTFKDENNWYWQEANKIWSEGPESVTGWLASSREYMNISDEDRASQFENLSSTMNTAFTNLQTAAGYSDRLSDGVVSNKADEIKSKLDNTNNNLSFINDRLGLNNAQLVFSTEKISENLDSKTKEVVQGITTVKDNLLKYYETKVTPGMNGIQDLIKSYLGGESAPVLKSLGNLVDSVSAMNGSIASILEGYSSVLTTFSNTIIEGIKTATKEYLETDNKLYKWLQEKYGIKTAEEKKTTQVSTPQPSKNNTNTSNSNNKNNNAGRGNSSAGKNVKVGGYVKASSGAKIYTTMSGGSGQSQYYSNDPKYKVLQVSGKRALVRYHKLNSGYTGWFNLSDLTGYSKGGYVNYTGLAAVHGKTNNPEAFLNAKQTALFETLRDTLTRATSTKGIKNSNESAKEEYNIENISIEVKQVADVDEIEKVTRKVKEQIYKDSIGKNNMAIRRR